MGKFIFRLISLLFTKTYLLFWVNVLSILKIQLDKKIT